MVRPDRLEPPPATIDGTARQKNTVHNRIQTLIISVAIVASGLPRPANHVIT